MRWWKTCQSNFWKLGGRQDRDDTMSKAACGPLELKRQLLLAHTGESAEWARPSWYVTLQNKHLDENSNHPSRSSRRRKIRIIIKTIMVNSLHITSMMWCNVLYLICQSMLRIVKFHRRNSFDSLTILTEITANTKVPSSKGLEKSSNVLCAPNFMGLYAFLWYQC